MKHIPAAIDYVRRLYNSAPGTAGRVCAWDLLCPTREVVQSVKLREDEVAG